LQQISTVLIDTASEARQMALRSEVAALTDAFIELVKRLMQRVSQLEVIDQRWTELGTQSNELRTLLYEKQETLQQTMHDSSLTPDQQYAVVKVRVIFGGTCSIVDACNSSEIFCHTSFIHFACAVTADLQDLSRPYSMKDTL